jgi:hypothetical protein
VTTAIALSDIFIPRWNGPLDSARFRMRSLNEIAETRLARRRTARAQRFEFWKDKKRAVVYTRVSRRSLTWDTTGYIRSGPRVSIISSTISSYLVVRERSPRPRRRAHSKKNSLRCRVEGWTVKWPLSLETSLKLVAGLFRIIECAPPCASVRYGALGTFREQVARPGVR